MIVFVLMLTSRIEPGSACYVKNLHCFFPAVLLAFEPAQAASEKDRYEVRDMTGYRQFVSRRGIIFPGDKEIATCTVCGNFTALTPAGQARTGISSAPTCIFWAALTIT